MPEEINRIGTDEFSEYLFLHSEEPVSYPERKLKTPKRVFWGASARPSEAPRQWARGVLPRV